jgi:hypothetical protein
VKALAVKGLMWAGVALALLGTLSLYNRPDFLVNLADQLWSCF